MRCVAACSFSTPDDYVNMLSEELWAKISPAARRVARVWKSDAEFARSFLSGVHTSMDLQPLHRRATTLG
jgi:hypothetical protein